MSDDLDYMHHLEGELAALRAKLAEQAARIAELDRVCAWDAEKIEALVIERNEAKAALADARRDAERLRAALRECVGALNSDPPAGPQKTIDRDGIIYHLDGQAVYRALNTARAALAQPATLEDK
jgi:hypothetical protein